MLPKLNEAPCVAQDPDYKRARENDKLRQQRNGAKKLFMNGPQLPLMHLRYIIAGEVAGGWGASGGMGAMLSHLAHLHTLEMTQNAETSFRFERAQSAKWSQLARNRGDPEAIKNDLRALNRESLAQCASDQLTEFNERKKGYGQKKQSKATTSACGKGGRRNRSRSRRRGARDSYGKAYRTERVGSYRRSERYKKEESKKQDTKKEDERKGNRLESRCLISVFAAR